MTPAEPTESIVPDDIKSLLAAARSAATGALAPYSGFKVGAALLISTSEVITACNIESPLLTSGICAERLVVFKALSEGHKDFKALAVVSADGGECSPCGACRQLLYEYSPEIKLYVEAERGFREFSLTQLLPHPFKK